MNKNDELEQQIIFAINKLPRIRFAHLPTPLEECTRLTEYLNGPKILIKRDDCTGLAMGGNKTRIIEFTFGEAKSLGADTIIQGADSQSNHGRQIAAAGAKLGLNVFLNHWKGEKGDIPQGNLLLDYLLGAEICFSNKVGAEKNMESKKELAEKLRVKGYKPYIMGPPRTPVLAAIAYLNCGVELIQQLRDRKTQVSHIYVASEGGTQVGLVLANKLFNMNWKIVGINPLYKQDDTKEKMARIANEAIQLLGLNIKILPEDINNTGEFIGEGYGITTDAAKEAIRLMAGYEGILLDPIYTGKAMSAVINDIHTDKLKSSDTVLFLHTGGLPLIFAYAEELLKK